MKDAYERFTWLFTHVCAEELPGCEYLIIQRRVLAPFSSLLMNLSLNTAWNNGRFTDHGHVWEHISDRLLSRGSWLLTDANWLFSCNSDRAIYHLWSHYVRAKRSRNTGILRGVSHGRDFEVWPKLSQAILLMSPALVTITANSTSPLSHFNGDFQSWENFFQCQWNTVKSKISLIILSKWNVCLGGF